MKSRKILETLSTSWKVRLYSRGLKHGPRQWQEDYRRAKEHLRGVRKQWEKRQQKCTTIPERWDQDDVYRTNQSTLHGWTIEYVKYLD